MILSIIAIVVVIDMIYLGAKWVAGFDEWGEKH